MLWDRVRSRQSSGGTRRRRGSRVPDHGWWRDLAERRLPESVLLHLRDGEPRVSAAARVRGRRRAPPQGVVLYRSDDGGLTWNAIIHRADARYGVTGLVVDSQSAADTIYVATGNGVYRYVETELLHVPPANGGIRLASRPNPFGVQTTLDFTLARRSNVRLEILGVDGRRITTLVRGERDAGTYVAAWDATDRPSGVYYVVLKTPEWTRTLRLVRVR